MSDGIATAADQAATSRMGLGLGPSASSPSPSDPTTQSAGEDLGVADQEERTAAADAADGQSATAAAAAREVVVMPVVVKADVQGSAEAVRAAVEGLSSSSTDSSNVVVRCLYVGVGPVGEADVNLAAATGAKLVAFNVRPPVAAVEGLIRKNGVQVGERGVLFLGSGRGFVSLRILFGGGLRIGDVGAHHGCTSYTP